LREWFVVLRTKFEVSSFTPLKIGKAIQNLETVVVEIFKSHSVLLEVAVAPFSRLHTTNY